MQNKKFAICLGLVVVAVSIIMCCIIFRYDKTKVGNVLVITDRFTNIQKIVYPNGYIAVRGEKGELEGPFLDPINAKNMDLRVTCAIKWRDGKLYYSVTALMSEDDYLSAVESFLSQAQITVELKDQGNYVVYKLPINIRGFTRTNSPEPVIMSKYEAYHKLVVEQKIDDQDKEYV